MKTKTDIMADILRTLDDTRQMLIIRQSMTKAAADSLPSGATVEDVTERAKELIHFVLYGELKTVIPEIDISEFMVKEEEK